MKKSSILAAVALLASPAHAGEAENVKCWDYSQEVKEQNELALRSTGVAMSAVTTDVRWRIHPTGRCVVTLSQSIDCGADVTPRKATFIYVRTPGVQHVLAMVGGMCGSVQQDALVDGRDASMSDAVKAIEYWSGAENKERRD
jgi:hypothetical protein